MKQHKGIQPTAEALHTVFMGAMKLRAKDFSEDAAVRIALHIYAKTYDGLCEWVNDKE